MKKILSAILVLFLVMPNAAAQLTEEEIDDILSFRQNKCENIKQTDIPTIFIPGILASWYSEYWYEESKVKRWIPDPITHTYDTLFYTFKKEGYNIKDVFYKNEFETYTIWNPKQSLYLLWYDWKKDNKITATMLSELILEIRLKYEEENGCDIGTVNIVAHSMWWLIARAMLQDMCASREDIKDYYKNTKKWQIKYINSSFCNNFTRVNKLITISTPQRWSPNSLPMWTKWDINATNAFKQSVALKTQLWVASNHELYKVIHWYDEKITNWIITIWQLLPDIAKSWEFNNELSYLYKDNQKLERKNHPKNQFLEELNSSDGIEKMFKNIRWKYSLYYTKQTDNFEKNNIIGYELEKLFTDQNWNYIEDKTEEQKSKDIYEKFSEKLVKKSYNINKNIRNNKWLWWDWTVPTNNLLLTANDFYKKTEIVNNKLETIEKECFKDWEETLVSKDLWEFDWELCSHTRTPTLVSIDIVEKIIWKETKKEEKIKQLYSNMWYIDYSSKVTDTTKKDSISWDIEIKTTRVKWIKNEDRIDNLLKTNYVKQFQNREEVDDFYENRKLWWRQKIKWWNLVWALVRYEIRSPINLIIEDEKWRKIWIDPDTWELINQIPWAWTSWDTEHSWQKEYFLIPKTWTWELNHKIHSFWTWDWEYHIVVDSIEEWEETKREIIKWNAKKWVLEWYDIQIKEKKIEYKKEKTNYYKINKKKKEVSIEEKYASILKTLKNLIDKKYSIKQKEILKDRLIIFSKNIEKTKFKNNEKVKYLVGELVLYL